MKIIVFLLHLQILFIIKSINVIKKYNDFHINCLKSGDQAVFALISDKTGYKQGSEQGEKTHFRGCSFLISYCSFLKIISPTPQKLIIFIGVYPPLPPVLIYIHPPHPPEKNSWVGGACIEINSVSVPPPPTFFSGTALMVCQITSNIAI